MEKSAKSKVKCAGTPKASLKMQKASPKVQKASPKVQKRVANKAGSETGKKNSSSLTSETSQVHESSNTVCPNCLTNIVDATDMCEGQEALFCEGACQCWYHRWCVGVTQARFQPLSESPEPFLCPACTSQQQQKAIEELQGCVHALTAEILELKATISGLQRTAAASTNEQPTTRVNTKTTEGTYKLPWSVVASRGCAKASKGKYPINGTGNKSKHQYAENQSQPSSSPDSHSRRVPIEDARKVWGTMKSATPSVIINAIKRLIPISSLGQNLRAKRKYKTSQDGSVKK